MTDTDHEDRPSSDECANRSVSWTLILDDSSPSRQIRDIGRRGGEARVEARLTFKRTGVGRSLVISSSTRERRGRCDRR